MVLGRRKVTKDLDGLYKDLAGVTVRNIKVEYEMDGKDIILSPQVAALFYPDSNGRLRPLINTSGKVESTEDSALASLLKMNQIGNQMSQLTFGGTFSDETEAWRGKHKLAIIPIVTDGAGDSAVVDVVGTVAGYFPCCRLLYVYADGTDGAWDIAFTVSAGAFDGIPAMTALATTVNVIGPDWGDGLVFKGDTDGAIFRAQIANGGNVITYFLVIEYWSET